MKPNVVWGGGVSKKMPKYGMITTSRIIEDLIELLRERGCEDISIGEGSVTSEELGLNTFKGYKRFGFSRVAKKYGVGLIDFNKESYRKIELDGVKIEISDIALESDFLINLPVLKTHAMTKVSLGMKNLKGCLDTRSKMEFHKRDLEHMIALLNTQLKPKLTIIDGIYALEHGPLSGGTAHRMNLIFAGKDNLSCDIVGSTVLGIDPSSVEHIKEFASITNRSLGINTIDIKGEKITDVTKKLEWESDLEDIFCQAKIKGVTILDPGNHFCTECVGNIGTALVLFSKDNTGITLDDIEICVGAEVRPKKESKKVFLLGNCSIQANKDLKDAIRVKGCGPKTSDTLVTLMDNTLDKRRVRKILMVRLFKNIANKLGIYNEDLPRFWNRYKSPEFDKSHFS